MSGLALPTTASRDPVMGWRAWALFRGPRGGSLRLQSITGGRTHWRPGETAHATCWRPLFHRAPAESCRCGLYGSRTVEMLRHAMDGTVVGNVAMWGRIVEHERGFRAEYAYPQRIRLICRPCFWQRSLGRADPGLVARLPRGRMLPLCEPHLDLAVRNRIRPREIVAAHEVERELLDTYGVDVLRTAVRPGRELRVPG